MAIDHILTVDDLPGAGDGRNVRSHQIFFGGGGSNVAAGIAKLGGSPELISTIGNDFTGSDYEKYLNELGVTINPIVSKDKNNATAYMVNSSDGKQFSLLDPGASILFETTDAPELDFVHLATSKPEYIRKVVSKAKFSSFDPGQDISLFTADQLKEIIPRVTHLSCNNYESDIICNRIGITEEELTATVPLRILTRGANGSTLFYNGDEISIPAVPTHMVDPTGAGDSYCAGFLTAFRRGYAPPICCQIGAVTSSFVVEKMGPQTNLPNWQQMTDRYSDMFGTLKKSE